MWLISQKNCHDSSNFWKCKNGNNNHSLPTCSSYKLAILMFGVVYVLIGSAAHLSRDVLNLVQHIPSVAQMPLPLMYV